MAKKKKTHNKLKTNNLRDSICPHIHTHILVNLDLDGCYSCCLIHYNGGELKKIESYEESEQGIHIMQTYFHQVKSAGEVLNAKVYYKDFGNELESFQNDLDLLKTRLLKAIESKANFEYIQIKSDLFKLKQRFDESQLFMSYARLKAHNQVSRKLNLSINSDSDEDEDTRDQQRFLAAKEKLANEHQKNLKKETENIRRLTEEQYAGTIEELTNKLHNSETENQRLGEMNSKTSDECRTLNEDRDKYKELYAQLQEDSEKLKEECKDQIAELTNEKSSLMNSLKNSWKLFTDFYNQKTGKNVAALEKDFKLELDISQSSHLEVLRLMKVIKLPNCKQVKLEEIKNDNKNVAEFLANSLPDQLELFSFNYANGEELLKSSFYIEGLARAAKATTREVFVNMVDFSASDFERLFKCCAHVQRLTFCYCKLDLSTPPDLKGPDYKVQYLSFDECGDSHSNDWKNNKDKVEALLKAVAQSSLKDSLQTLNIISCGLDVKEVEGMLETLQMHPQVTVITKREKPLED